jgi:hypothetical protein
VDTAEQALYHFAKTPIKFVFKRRGLKLDRHKNTRQQSKTTTAEQSIDNDASNTVNFNITNVHYGTFIMGAAMNNITGTNKANGFGLIAHRLLNNERNFRLRLRIDTQEKKFSIIISYESLSVWGSSIELAFTWPFGA